MGINELVGLAYVQTLGLLMERVLGCIEFYGKIISTHFPTETPFLKSHVTLMMKLAIQLQ